MKPVETGVERSSPTTRSRLRDAAADPAPLDDDLPYRLRAPLAPAVAARLEGVTIDLGAPRGAGARGGSRDADVLLVEGAGGLLVPIADSVDVGRPGGSPPAAAPAWSPRTDSAPSTTAR